MKSFKYWKAQEVEETFGVKEVESLSLLEEWLSAKVIPTKEEQKRLVYLQNQLRKHIRNWNEAALKFFFIGGLIDLVDFFATNYTPFLEPKLSIQHEGKTASGNIDLLVATGKQIPRTPYYLLHEYKPDSRRSLDPLGQLLIAMVAAQNENKKINRIAPLYGAYIMGRNWFFVVLEKENYAVSRAYDATQEDLYDIFSILRKCKEYFSLGIETF